MPIGVLPVLAKAEAKGVPVEEWCEEYFGAGAFGGPTVELDGEPPEVVGRLAWRTADPESAAYSRFGKFMYVHRPAGA